MSEKKKHLRATSRFRPAAIPSRFQLKASYQRHMLYGMLCAAVLVVLPSMLVAYWPAAEPTDDVVIYEPPDTVVVIWEKIDKVILDDDVIVPVTPGGGGGGPEPSGGLFEEVVMVGDEILIDESELTGRNAGVGYGPSDIDDMILGSGEGHAIRFVQDTNIYPNASAVDRPPFLVAMDLPEYPANAQRLGIEGKVLLHVLVGLDGEAIEVRIVAESPEGMGFGANAVKTANQATFGPAIHRRQAVRCWVAFPVVFELGER